MSATEQMRAMLDGLMGTARDGSDSQRQHLHFTDPRVCRAFLLDCCPHDIFASTKLELGECSKVHDYALRADYVLANEKEDYFYEVSALDRLQNFVSDADKKTDYLKRKLAETQEELTAEETNKLNRVHDLTEELGKKLAQVDKAEIDGDLEAKQKFYDEAEKIKKQRIIAEAEYREVSRPTSSHQQQNLRVCDICSAYLGINDNDARLADHFGGKLHLGFITVRDKLDELKKIVAEKRANRANNNNNQHNDRPPTNRSRANDRERERSYEFDGYDRTARDYPRDRDYEHSRNREYDRFRSDRADRGERGDFERGSYRDRDNRDRGRDRYRERDNRKRERSRSSGRRDYRDGRDSRPRDRYRDDRGEYDRYDARVDKNDRDKSERHDSIVSSRSGRGAFDRGDKYDEREVTYQRRLKDWERREVEMVKKHAIRMSEERDRRQLEEQESKKLKEFFEDYKDDRDDIRFYRGSALSKRLAVRHKELEQDEISRQKEKIELEQLSRSCEIEESKIQSAEMVVEPPSATMTTVSNSTNTGTTTNSTNPTNGESNNGQSTNDDNDNSTKDESLVANSSSTSTKAPPINLQTTKVSSSEDKRKQVEELIGRIPTDKDQLFKRQLDWSLLDENLMEKRIRPWITKKIAEYMGEKEVDLIDFVCTLLNNHTDGSSMLREVAIVLDDEAEKFVVHMWRLLIFELEAKKIGLRK